MISWIFNFLIVILLPYVSSSCGFQTKMEPQKPATVFIKKIQLEEISEIFTYPARVKTKKHSTLLSELDGIVSKVLITLGKEVSLRQPLIILRHTDPIYQYALVQVCAPISGTVSSIDVTQGSHVVQGQKLASIIDPFLVEIQVEIPAQDLATIKKRMSGEFRISGQDKSLKVQVLGVSPWVDPTTGTALAQLEIDSSEQVSPGIQGQVSFKVNSRQGVLISNTSLIYKGKDPFVRILEHEKVKHLPVVLGAKRQGRIEILDGLDPGIQLIERSSRFVAEGDPVLLEQIEPSGHTPSEALKKSDSR